MTKEYVLMNREVPVLRFLCERNTFDEPEFTEIEWLTELRPIGYGNLSDYLARRQAPKHRKHIKELLERYGCDDLEGFLRVTHALSLNDTFWVKEAESELCWKDVSLYQNEFDLLVSEAAFDGVISETDLSSTSPEFGTDGYYAKCWVRDKDALGAPDWYIDYCRPKLGRDFIITARGLLTDEIRADLEELKDYQFTNHPRIPISEKRLDLLGAIVQRQIRLILQ